MPAWASKWSSQEELTHRANEEMRKLIQSPISLVMSSEIVHQHFKHFVLSPVRWTRIYHSTRILFNFQLVHDHLPDSGETTTGTSLTRANAAMGHLVIERIGPQWRVAGRCRHGRVVNETELLHHEELAVPSNA